eukprot:TRINITY_DN25635_c0_g1_i1.p1 TRINITY_DN25635_c0_g1~~TRINITY_DN25635_c0_g1_i1.p1  ORF type:complete len:308 (-),score=48.82 TRINITY_DN25635_c0_g1_i1:25-948(-)
MGEAFSACKGHTDDDKRVYREVAEVSPAPTLEGYPGIVGEQASLDGRWATRKGELQTIDGKTLTWPGGNQSDISLHRDEQGRVCCSISLRGDSYIGTLAPDGRRIAWTDGDVWTREDASKSRICSVGAIFGMNCCDDEEAKPMGPSVRFPPPGGDRVDGVPRDPSGRPDFSGTWICTDASGDFDSFFTEMGLTWMQRTAAKAAGNGNGQKRVIDQKGDEFRVDLAGSRTQTFRVDGNPHQTEAQSGPVNITATWENKEVLKCVFTDLEGNPLPMQRTYYVANAAVMMIEAITPNQTQVKWTYQREQP